MIVFLASSDQIDLLNVNDFFTDHTLAKDKEGLHYYPVERYLKINLELTDEQKTLLESLEKVEFDTIEQVEEPEFITIRFLKKTKKEVENKPIFYEKGLEITVIEEEALFYIESGDAVEI